MWVKSRSRRILKCPFKITRKPAAFYWRSYLQHALSTRWRPGHSTLFKTPPNYILTCTFYCTTPNRQLHFPIFVISHPIFVHLKIIDLFPEHFSYRSLPALFSYLLFYGKCTIIKQQKTPQHFKCQGVNWLLQKRLERSTYGLGNRCSIHLSYWSHNFQRN